MVDGEEKGVEVEVEAGQRTQVWKVLGCVYRGRSMMSSVCVCPEES